MIEGKTVTLYLTSWQKRLIADHLKAHNERLGLANPYDNLTKMAFHFENPVHLVTYRVPNFDFYKDGGILLHFTDEQISEVVECTGLKTKINAMMITPEMLKEKTVVFG
jgi:hypothetical protein